MFSFLLPKDRWKWNPEQGVPNKKAIKAQRQALRSGSEDVKKRLLEHIADLADDGPDFQSALCDGKVTSDVCACFLTGSVTVQQAAALALVALCDGHPGNCAAVVAAHHGKLPAAQQPLSHALKVLQDKDLGLAIAAAGLLDVLAASSSSSVVQQLQQPGSLSRLLQLLRGWSRAAVSSSTPAPSCAKLLKLLQLTLGVLQSAASSGGPAMCRELFKAHAMGMLLEMAQEHRGQRPPPGGEASGVGHAAVVRDALNLLFVMLSQAHAHRAKLQEADGVQRLLAVMRDLTLPWSAKLQAVAALTAAAGSTAVAEEVRARGLDEVMGLLNAVVNGRMAPGAGAANTPARVASPAGPNTPMQPRSPVADSPFGSPLAAAAAGCGQDPEPGNPVVVEQLLGLLDAVVGAVDTPELLEERRLGIVLAALNTGLASFLTGGFKMATASAQVLFRLSTRATGTPPHQLCGGNVTGPLGKLVGRAQEHAAACSGKDAQILHGAWCAEGLLCKVLDAEQRRGQSQAEAVASGISLRQAVRLLDASAGALLVAVGAAPPPYAAPAAPIWQTPGPGAQGQETLRPDGRAYFAKERVVADLRAAVPVLLQLLGDLAQRLVVQALLRELGTVEAVKRLLPWHQVQWRVKRLLHLLGEREVEYKPFTAYGCGPLLAALLTSQRLDPRPFLEQGVDAHLLLRLDDNYLRQRLGLDEAGLLKMGRIRDAHSLFVAIDGVDGRVDGCVTAADLEAYLTNNANLRARDAQYVSEDSFRQLQVLPGEPINFMQFLQVYPALDVELQAVMPLRCVAGRRMEPSAGPGGARGGSGGGGSGGGGSGGGGSGGAAAAEAGGLSRAFKFQRVGGGSSSSEPIELD